MITHQQLYQALLAAGIRQEVIQLMDQEYALTTEAWVTGPLGAAMAKFLFDTGITYTAENYDCNKFAKTASTIADWCWAKDHKEDSALAFGLFGYIPANGLDGHMINVAAHRAPDQSLVLKFYEPQPSNSQLATICLTPTTLTPDEIRLCFACLFV